jgi:hypothetical protein
VYFSRRIGLGIGLIRTSHEHCVISGIIPLELMSNSGKGENVVMTLGMWYSFPVLLEEDLSVYRHWNEGV